MHKVILDKFRIELFLWNIICISIIAKLLNFKGAAMNDSWDVSDFIQKQNSNRTCGLWYTHYIANMYDTGPLSFWTFINVLILTPF